MFDPGTKIVLLESTHQKTVGPRKGSIGYIASCGPCTPHSVITPNLDTLSVSASLCSIFFIRYGFEEQGRFEAKTVLCISPMIKNGIEISATEQATDLCQKLSSSKSAPIWDRLRAEVDTSPGISVCLAIPIEKDNTTLLDCSDFEFKAWFSSVVCAESVRNYIDRVLSSDHYKTSKDMYLRSELFWRELRTIASDKAFRIEYLNELVKDKYRKEALITNIRKILALINRGRVSREVMELVMSSHNAFDFYIELQDLIIKYTYNTPVFDKFIVEYSIEDNPPHISSIKKLNALVLECRSLANTMLSSNKGFGYTASN